MYMQIISVLEYLLFQHLLYFLYHVLCVFCIYLFCFFLVFVLLTDIIFPVSDLSVSILCVSRFSHGLLFFFGIFSMLHLVQLY
jgi:hypothetical protein